MPALSKHVIFNNRFNLTEPETGKMAPKELIEVRLPVFQQYTSIPIPLLTLDGLKCPK